MTFQESLAALHKEGYVPVPQHEGFLFNASPVQTIDLFAGFPGRFFGAPFMFNDHCAHDRSPSSPDYRRHDLMHLLEQYRSAAASVEKPSDLQALCDVLWN